YVTAPPIATAPPPRVSPIPTLRRGRASSAARLSAASPHTYTPALSFEQSLMVDWFTAHRTTTTTPTASPPPATTKGQTGACAPAVGASTAGNGSGAWLGVGWVGAVSAARRCAASRSSSS